MDKLASGRFLLAKSSLDGTYFGKRIVLLLNYSPEEGAYGLVVNRVARMPINEVFSGVPQSHRKSYPFFLGGPVEEQNVQLLQMTRYQEGEPALSHPEQQHLDLEELLRTIDDPSTRAFLGYSGWNPGQLEEELEQDNWEVHRADPLEVLHRANEVAGIDPDQFKEKFGAQG